MVATEYSEYLLCFFLIFFCRNHTDKSIIYGYCHDSSYTRGEPTSFALGGVVPGFREGISKMKVGGKWKLFIPSALGYGEVGAPGAIGPNEPLVFEVELISVKEKEAPAEKKEG